MTKEQQTRHTYRIIKIMNAACDMADNTITLVKFSDMVGEVLVDVRNEYSVDPRLLKRQCEDCGDHVSFPDDNLCRICYKQCIENDGCPCDLKRPCCDRVGEYNGLGRKGPLRFVCPKACACHD